MNSRSVSLRMLLPLCFVAGVMMVMSAKAADPAVKKADSAIGEISFTGGKVSAVSATGVERSLMIKSAIYLNDKIVCGPGGKLEIIFSDKSVMSLGENSEIVIDEYIYAPDRKKDISFGMRFIKGACRIVTGAITKLNPERFKVHTRMATVGIRGCDIGIAGEDQKNDIYVLGLGKDETVGVETTSNGKPVMDMATGRSLDIDAATRKFVNVDRPGTVVAIVEGQGFQQRVATPAELDMFLNVTSHMPAARYDPVFSSDWSTIQLRPGESAQGGKKAGAQ